MRRVNELAPVDLDYASSLRSAPAINFQCRTATRWGINLVGFATPAECLERIIARRSYRVRSNGVPKRTAFLYTQELRAVLPVIKVPGTTVRLRCRSSVCAGEEKLSKKRQRSLDRMSAVVCLDTWCGASCIYSEPVPTLLSCGPRKNSRKLFVRRAIAMQKKPCNEWRGLHN